MRMTSARVAVLLLGLAALAAAGLVAVLSRAPAELRRPRPPADATDPELRDRFTDLQIRRHAAYRRPTYAAFAVGVVLEILLLVVFVRRPELTRWVERVPGPAPVGAAVLGVALALASALLTLPLGFVRGYVVEHAWELSTQDALGWLSDRGRAALVTAVTGAIAAGAFYAFLRAAPRTWWVWGWAAFTGLIALLTFLWPVVIAPLFNRFTPLEAGPVRTRLERLADKSGVEVGDVLVADASRRTTTENAYVAGLGATKQLVVYDTLLASQDEAATAVVVAHELGHEVERHVLKNVALASITILAGFVLLWWGSRQSWFASLGATGGLGDVRSLPLVVLLATVASLLVLPAQNAVSRSFERRADEFALELTDDPQAAIRLERRLAFSNLADLRPPRSLVLLLYTHPPIAERIRAAVAYMESAP